MSQYKRDAGLCLTVDLEFLLEVSREGKPKVKFYCNVSHLRRLSQDTCHLGLRVIGLTDVNEKRVSDFVQYTYPLAQ